LLKTGCSREYKKKTNDYMDEDSDETTEEDEMRNSSRTVDSRDEVKHIERNEHAGNHITTTMLSCGVVCVIIRLAVLVELRLVTDGQTQGHG